VAKIRIGSTGRDASGIWPGRGSPFWSPPYGGVALSLLRGVGMMGKPLRIDIVRRAYELWQQAGEPEGRDQEFYLEAERQLTEAAEKDASDGDR
jgi:hypothetical protein